MLSLISDSYPFAKQNQNAALTHATFIPMNLQNEVLLKKIYFQHSSYILKGMSPFYIVFILHISYSFCLIGSSESISI